MRKVWFVVFILVLAGCASGSSQRTILGLSGIESFGKTANIIVTAQDPDDWRLVQQVETSLSSNLNTTPAFDMARPDLVPSDYVIEVLIIDAKSVSDSKRVLLGALAGRAKITLRASLFEYGNDEPLGIVEVDAQSSGGTVFAGTDMDSVEKATMEIAQWIRGQN